ncbi:MAG TPA: Uma2 family endonuclease [Candidatus Blautia faecipullorum]|nr:Uma2 family endonuclease [Candidatus Blautia faecipullorum]
MPLPNEKNYTIEDIYALPEGQRAELINGKIYDMAPPSRIHQKLVMELSATIRDYIRNNGGSCEVYPAPFAVFLNDDDKNYVEPDISVICDKNKLTDRGCEGAPDLIIEIVSPSSRHMDYAIKNSLYSSSGVREYWIVDPAKQRTTVYRYVEDAAPIITPFDRPLRFFIYSDLQVVMSEFL